MVGWCMSTLLLNSYNPSRQLSLSSKKTGGEEKRNQRKCVTLWGRRLHRQAKNRAAAVATPQEIEKQEAINITNRSKIDMT